MKKATFIAIALALVAGLGCDLFKLPTGNPGNSEWQEPITPLAVLENIEFCYINELDELYAILLDEENFVFYFAESDVGGDIPYSWTYQYEMDATKGIFEAASSITLSLDFTNSETEPEPTDTEFDIKNVAYELYVDVGEGLAYRARAHADFTLSKFEDSEGLMRWWLTYWWDIVT